MSSRYRFSGEKINHGEKSDSETLYKIEPLNKDKIESLDGMDKGSFSGGEKDTLNDSFRQSELKKDKTHWKGMEEKDDVVREWMKGFEKFVKKNEGGPLSLEKLQEFVKQQWKSLESSVSGKNRVEWTGHFTREHLEEILKERTKTAVFVFLSLLAITGFSIYMVWNPLRRFFGMKGAEVASDTLRSDALKVSVENLSKEVINNILTDNHTTTLLTQQLHSLVHRKDTHETLIGLLKRLFTDEKVKVDLGILLKGQIVTIFKDPETLEIVTEFFGKLLRKEETKDNLRYLLNLLLEDEKFRVQVTRFVKETLSQQQIKDITTHVLTVSAKDALHSETLKKSGKAYLEDVFSDESIRLSAANAVKGAAVQALIPQFFFSTFQPTKSTHPDNVIEAHHLDSYADRL